MLPVARAADELIEATARIVRAARPVLAFLASEMQ